MDNWKIELYKSEWENISKIMKLNNFNISYEILKEVNPHQLYLTFSSGSKKERIPFWIYKIENNKLIISQAKEFHKYIWLMDMWVSRYQLPTDFAWNPDIYYKVNDIPEDLKVYSNKTNKEEIRKNNEIFSWTEWKIFSWYTEQELNIARQIKEQGWTQDDFIDILNQLKSSWSLQ